MGAGGRADRGVRRRGDAASVVVPLPRRIAGSRLDLAFALVAGAFAAYWVARASPLFDVQRVEVQGAPTPVAQSVERLLKGTVGTSLLAIETSRIEATVQALPTVAAVAVDRAFPHTLVVKVAAARPVAVLRHGHDSWLVTGQNEVIGRIATGTERTLPRIWVPGSVPVHVGVPLPAAYAPGTRLLAAVRDAHFGPRVKTVRTDGELTLVLRRGIWLELGDDSSLLVKLAVAETPPLTGSGRSPTLGNE
jgi:hypothetical protein